MEINLNGYHMAQFVLSMYYQICIINDLNKLFSRPSFQNETTYDKNVKTKQNSKLDFKKLYPVPHLDL